MRVRKELRKNSVNVLTGYELMKYLEKNFEGCSDYDRNKFDLLSLIEQEMAFRSKIFLRALGSSWSANVQDERILADNEHQDQKNIQFFHSYLQILQNKADK